MTAFPDALYQMRLGDRISSGDKASFVFEWEITRVPGGWIYSCPAGQGHSVFVPFNNGFAIDF
jgi:hypothetical protein